MIPPNNTHDISPRGILSLRVRTNSRNPVRFRAYDKGTGFPLFVNGRDYLDLYPSESLASGYQQLVIKGKFVINHIAKYCI